MIIYSLSFGISSAVSSFSECTHNCTIEADMLKKKIWIGQVLSSGTYVWVPVRAFEAYIDALQWQRWAPDEREICEIDMEVAALI
jgi:hypothetical protein